MDVARHGDGDDDTDDGGTGKRIGNGNCEGTSECKVEAESGVGIEFVVGRRSVTCRPCRCWFHIRCGF